MWCWASARDQSHAEQCQDADLSDLHSLSHFFTAFPLFFSPFDEVVDSSWKKSTVIDHMLTDTFCSPLLLGCKNPTAHLFYDVTALMIG